ncbi:MAG: hypothetical protein R3Y32_09155 [Bacillota bacterium]
MKVGSSFYSINGKSPFDYLLATIYLCFAMLTLLLIIELQQELFTAINSSDFLSFLFQEWKFSLVIFGANILPLIMYYSYIRKNLNLIISKRQLIAINNKRAYKIPWEAIQCCSNGMERTNVAIRLKVKKLAFDDNSQYCDYAKIFSNTTLTFIKKVMIWDSESTCKSHIKTISKYLDKHQNSANTTAPRYNIKKCNSFTVFLRLIPVLIIPTIISYALISILLLLIL